VDDEAFEESDDGDEEGREMDYDTSSSEEYLPHFIYIYHIVTTVYALF